MDINPLTPILVEELAERLESLKCLLPGLTQKPPNKKLIDEIYRLVHTIKGTAGTIGLTGMAGLTHGMEDLLDGIKDERVNVNPAVIDLLYRCVDGLQCHLASFGRNGSEYKFDNAAVLDRISIMVDKRPLEWKKGVNAGAYVLKLNVHEGNIIAAAIDNGFTAYRVRVGISKDCTMKWARAFVIFKYIEGAGEIIRSVPSVEDIENERFDDTLDLIVISKLEADSIRKGLMNISEVTYALVEGIDIGAVELTDGYQAKKGNRDVIERNGHAKSAPTKTVRVDVNRLDYLMNLVGELILVRSRLGNSPIIKESADAKDAFEYLDRITDKLQDTVLKLRMVPIGRVFSRFPGMVKDLSSQLKKEIAFHIYGEDIEVDSAIAELISDPLLHLIRNAADHGIEPAADRKRIGKPKAGMVVLRAYNEKNSVVIEVEDDGRGIDLKSVAARAIADGIISRQQADWLKADDLLPLIFRPGFSTAGQVTGLSGRGVGLDVVKTRIESVGGKVEVHSDEYKGCKFIIRLPVSLAIIQALLTKLGNQCYAIPLDSIREIVTIRREMIKRVHGREVVLINGVILPLIWLGEMLQVKSKGRQGRKLAVVVVHKGEKTAGMIVDSIMGQQEIIIHSVNNNPAGQKGIAGAAAIGDGRVSLILDIDSFL
jgi:two-component system chemotaxis sensor kinase CheA